MSLPIIVHCLLEQRGEVWQALSLEFGLAAQADTAEEAKAKLADMIADYLFDAMVGEDRDHATELLSRRAPLSAYLRYYWFKCVNWVGRARAYERPIPVIPAGCAAAE